MFSFGQKRPSVLRDFVPRGVFCNAGGGGSLNPLSINPPAQKDYITQNVVMIIANLVGILCKTEKYNS